MDQGMHIPWISPHSKFKWNTYHYIYYWKIIVRGMSNTNIILLISAIASPPWTLAIKWLERTTPSASLLSQETVWFPGCGALTSFIFSYFLVLLLKWHTWGRLETKQVNLDVSQHEIRGQSEGMQYVLGIYSLFSLPVPRSTFLLPSLLCINLFAVCEVFFVCVFLEYRFFTMWC